MGDRDERRPRGERTKRAGGGIRELTPHPDIVSDPHLERCERGDFDGQPVPTIGRIVLLSRLGRGGCGVVYHGVNPRLDTEVAVKILPRRIAGAHHDGVVSRFIREARLAAGLESEHLVRVLDVDEDEATGCHFIVMEYVHGVSAQEWLQEEPSARGGVAVMEALELCIAATKGLAAAHREGVLHRDVKPANILIPADADGTPQLSRAKLADLGLARAEEDDEGLTASGIAMMGTLGYVAPEQAEKATLARKPADVFSMGATLYALLTGRAPYRAQGAAQSLLRLATGNRPALTALRPDTPEPVVELVDTCLRHEPEDRFADAPALLEALERCRAGLDDIAAGGLTTDVLVATLREQAAAPETGRPVPPASELETVADERRPAPRRAATLALVVVAILLVAWLAGTWLAGPPTKAALAPTRVADLLTDLATWDAASSEEREAAARLVAEKIDGLRFRKLERCSAGGATHEVGMFEHRPSGLRMALIPVGTFETTSGLFDGSVNQGGKRRITLTRPFLIARHEVTQSQWRTYEKKRNRFLPKKERREKRFFNEGKNNPADYMSPPEAIEFCKEYGVDRPTEAQWEWACRAGTTSLWFHGDDPQRHHEYANFADKRFGTAKRSPEGKQHEPPRFDLGQDDGYAFTAPVGKFLPNAFGLFDMHGNVFEITRDAFEPGGPQRPGKTKTVFEPGEETDPSGERYSTGYFLARGGSFRSLPRGSVSAARAHPIDPNLTAVLRVGSGRNGFPEVGFRPILEVDLDELE